MIVRFCILANSSQRITGPLLKNSASFAVETSREIEERMRNEKFKNLQNNYKALHTKFGLKKPEGRSKSY